VIVVGFVLGTLLTAVNPAYDNVPQGKLPSLEEWLRRLASARRARSR